jgi:hypothetical protein
MEFNILGLTPDKIGKIGLIFFYLKLESHFSGLLTLYPMMMMMTVKVNMTSNMRMMKNLKMSKHPMEVEIMKTLTVCECIL